MARQRTPAKKVKKLSANASAEEITAFKEACGVVNVAPADMLRDLAHAFVEHVETHRHIVKPLRFSGPPGPDKECERQKSHA